MAQINILMYSLDEIPQLINTLYVRGYGNGKEIEKLMTDLGYPPSGWNSGYAYSAEINDSIDHKDAMTMEQLKEHFSPKQKQKKKTLKVRLRKRSPLKSEYTA
jgi:hypothetical protein